MTDEKITPIMGQYFAAKQSAPDCLLLFRLGDFYELFFDDAKKAADVLRLTLTKRGRHQGAEIPMCGVPARSLDYYLPRLLQEGYKIALCEQGEAGNSGLIDRQVTRIFTPGTVLDDALLQSVQRSYLAAVLPTNREQCVVALVDATDGDVRTFYTPYNDNLPQLLHIRGVREVLHPEHVNLPPLTGIVYTQRTAAMFAPNNGRSMVAHIYGLHYAEGLGSFSDHEFAVLGAVLGYMHAMHRGKVPLLKRPMREQALDALYLDVSSRRNLELTKTLEGDKSGSVLHTIDETCTAAGYRLLEQWLYAPLRTHHLIEQRLESVSFLVENAGLRKNIRHALTQLPDLSRALARLTGYAPIPRDLVAVRNVGHIARTLWHVCEGVLLPPLLQQQSQIWQQPCQSVVHITRALADLVPATFRDTGVIKRGFDDALDELCHTRDHGHQQMLAFEQQYRLDTGVNSLKLKHNNLLGYHLETSLSSGKKLLSSPYNDTFMHKRSTTTTMCFTTDALVQAERQLYDATDAAMARERSLCEALCTQVRDEAHILAQIAHALAVLDVLCSLAHVAAQQQWTRPQLTEQPQILRITQGRHLCVETRLKQQKKGAFVANDCVFTAPHTLFLVTGANTGGKSTYLRQNALIIILAQMGSFVPAKMAYLSIFDRIFCRAGASDDQARGRSTFAVEMIEAAIILNEATPYSFVVLDELGRGTATYDGMALARASAEHLVRHNRSLTLFATHYHELCILQNTLTAVGCLQVLVRLHKNELIFLHQIVEGAAGKSYGLVAARKAGLPASVVQRAEQLLHAYENKPHQYDPDTVAMPLFAEDISLGQLPKNIS